MKISKDSIGDRFKGYENASRHYHPRRLPLIIRVDGIAFHTLTRKLARPYDSDFMDVMVNTALHTAAKIQTCRFVYTQSDEISFLLINYEKLTTEPWFGNCKSKIESASAAIATAIFNKLRSDPYGSPPLGMFDSRSFVIPPSEVCNYFIWRQQDATRNAVSLAAQSQFSHKSLHGVSGEQMQERLFQEKGINFNDYPTKFKRGVAIYKGEGGVGWAVDSEIPIFTQDRQFIERHVFVGNDKQEDKND